MELSTENIISIVAIIGPFIALYILKIQRKADKADMIELIEKEIEPIDKRLLVIEVSVTELKTKNEVWDERWKNIEEMLERMPETMDKHIDRLQDLVEKQDRNTRDSIGKIFDKLEKKVGRDEI